MKNPKTPTPDSDLLARIEALENCLAGTQKEQLRVNDLVVGHEKRLFSQERALSDAFADHLLIEYRNKKSFLVRLRRAWRVFRNDPAPFRRDY